MYCLVWNNHIVLSGHTSSEPSVLSLVYTAAHPPSYTPALAVLVSAHFPCTRRRGKLDDVSVKFGFGGEGANGRRQRRKVRLGLFGKGRQGPDLLEQVLAFGIRILSP